jgi:hypothetical protein
MSAPRTQPNSEQDTGLLQQKLEFAEFEWNRATEGMQERDVRIKALEGALQIAQELFAIVVNPQDHPNTSVQHLWAQCKEIECKIRDLLKDGAK